MASGPGTDRGAPARARRARRGHHRAGRWSGAPAPPRPPVAAGPRRTCARIEEWQADFRGLRRPSCQEVSERTRSQCLNAPTPSAPDSGLAGWFAARPDSSEQPGPKGLYSDYGYAGYSYTTYDIGCGCRRVMHPDYKFENTVANGEFMIATAVIGASNALRERAWDPGVDVGLGRPAGREGDQGRLHSRSSPSSASSRSASSASTCSGAPARPT